LLTLQCATPMQLNRITTDGTKKCTNTSKQKKLTQINEPACNKL
jgi:hypothetical protein